ncbi:hypothetical protein Tco_1093229 [Tanacetum coccineum]|uniref:Uncharacterized protein n=1 Tax=Tanacetum coccineum TaxID=301880 RepID=A0ABQ5IC36_9ASTR
MAESSNQEQTPPQQQQDQLEKPGTPIPFDPATPNDFSPDLININQIMNVHKWILKKNQPEGPPFTAHMMDICNAKEPVAFKAPKTSSHIKEASTIIHSESTSGYDASADSTTEVDPSKSAPNDSLSKQQGSAKGTQNYSIDHIIACAYPISNDTTKDIKLKDLSKLIKDVGIDLMDLDLIEDDQSFIVQSDEEEEEVHAEPNAETKDTSDHAKLDEIQTSVSGLTNHVVKLNNIMLKLPARLLALQEKVSSIQASALHTTGEQSVPSAGPASAPPAEGENNIT